MTQFVLSLFPGIGMFDMAFEAEWGNDICLLRRMSRTIRQSFQWKSFRSSWSK